MDRQEDTVNMQVMFAAWLRSRKFEVGSLGMTYLADFFEGLAKDVEKEDLVKWYREHLISLAKCEEDQS